MQSAVKFTYTRFVLLDSEIIFLDISRSNFFLSTKWFNTSNANRFGPFCNLSPPQYQAIGSVALRLTVITPLGSTRTGERRLIILVVTRALYWIPYRGNKAQCRPLIIRRDLLPMNGTIQPLGDSVSPFHSPSFKSGRNRSETLTNGLRDSVVSDFEETKRDSSASISD